MAQTNLTIRIDEGIKQEAETLFNNIGLNMSSAINVFFRQAIREQAIPFELKPYDDYYTGENLKKLKRSMAQSNRGETISFTMSELEAMETGEIPQRALDFLNKHKGDNNNAPN
ncbi:MAG: type II toxin-antitoxin system RelB/DinJ family antitoxin [Oscillospiraceae bacterium]|nr:type II toxin-antitoxin system RelB/DinJ family antitoxin [Oscillospiraceae bacterium]